MTVTHQGHVTDICTFVNFHEFTPSAGLGKRRSFGPKRGLRTRYRPTQRHLPKLRMLPRRKLASQPRSAGEVVACGQKSSARAVVGRPRLSKLEEIPARKDRGHHLVIPLRERSGGTGICCSSTAANKSLQGNSNWERTAFAPTRIRSKRTFPSATTCPDCKIISFQ